MVMTTIDFSRKLLLQCIGKLESTKYIDDDELRYTVSDALQEIDNILFILTEKVFPLKKETKDDAR